MQKRFPFIKIDKKNITDKEKEKMKENKAQFLRHSINKKFNI